MGRGDVEAYEGREVKPEDDGVKVASKHTPVFPQMDRKPLRAKQGANVTQCTMHVMALLRLRWSMLRFVKG